MIKIFGLDTRMHQRLDGEEWGAVYSPVLPLESQARFRYALWRRWDASKRLFVVIGLNPSTATEEQNDPTITRCVGFARREQCGGYLMLNVYAQRSTDPRMLFESADPEERVGAHTSIVFMRAQELYRDALWVAAWGAFAAKDPLRFDRRLLASIEVPLYAFDVNANGTPKHPLYVRADQPLRPFK